MTTAGTIHAITVLGHDRPGIIAWTTDRLAALGLNIEDSSMTLLRGHFAMTLVCAGEVDAVGIKEALEPLGADGRLTVTVREVPVEKTAPVAAATPWVLTVHGGDRPGIVSTILREVARVEGNVTDLTTRLAGELYLLVAEVSLPAGVDAVVLEKTLKSAAAELGVGASLRPAEADEL
ncbi:glycine cleavage system protein R [Nocardioides yefusunii]|uniref:Glycine cleavage system protein R n=1 Tax=Nocardioides yefusunii TaxID=2500546 RepID=A0ABW1QVU8_9ACTN|nr:ACT domain-containing protein [Nocardioides yefusunii]